MESRIETHLRRIAKEGQEAEKAARKRHKTAQSPLTATFEGVNPRLEDIARQLAVVERGLREAKEDRMVIYREVSTIEAVLEGMVSSKMNKRMASL